MLISLQILRAIAVLLVIIVHFSVLAQKNIIDINIKPFYFGLAGVDIFFVISGFIMYYIISKPNVNKYEFLKHRFFRIFPLYWFYFSILLILAMYSPSLVTSYADTNLLASFLLLPSFSPSFLNVSWTLVYEMYFYFVVFIFMVFFKNTKYFLIFLMTIFLISFLISFLNKLPELNAIFLVYGSPLLFEFLMGGCVYILVSKLNKLNRLYSFLLLFFSLCLLFASHRYYIGVDTFFTEIFNGYKQYGRVIYFGIPSAIFVYSVLQFEVYFKESSFSLVNFFNYLGNASYSLYLSHYFVLVFLFKVFDKLPITVDTIFEIIIVFITFMIISVSLGLFLYEYIEIFLLKEMRKIRDR